MIGGTGADLLQGGGGDDLIIGNGTAFDSDLTALLALMAEWGRTDANYETRVNHLKGTLTGGLNANSFLSGDRRR